jgi:DivIVA domain-containing protein
MFAFVAFVVGVLVVGGLLFLGASVLLGRGETQPPAELDRSPVELPDDRPVTADDIRALRIAPVFRGYRMSEVDWLLDQFALVLDERDAEIAALTKRLHPAQPSEDETATPDEPAPDEPAPDEPAPDQAASDDAAPADESAPDDAAPADEEQRRA